jgi:hypothetical protein
LPRGKPLAARAKMDRIRKVNFLPQIVARRTLAPGATFFFLAVLLAGCGRDDVKVYHVAKDNSAAPPPAAMPATMPAGLPAPDNSGLPPLKYVLPAGWQEKPASQMRVASFGISEDAKEADVSVIPLGGMAGGDLANVNRWRGQVGLPSLADDEIANLAEKISVGAQPADLYDITGGAQRILAVIFHRGDVVWFFKVTGDADLVEKQKPAFISFLKSVQFGAPAMDMSQLPPSHPPIDGMSLGNQNSLVPNTNTIVNEGANSDDNGKLIWTVPSDWHPLPPSQFLFAKFSIIGTNEAKAEVNVAQMSGDGGGLIANANRWRKQLGLPPVAEKDLPITKISAYVGKDTIQIVEFSVTDSKTGKPVRLVGAVVSENGQTWFYKLMGDEPVVARQKDAFIQFVQSAKYPNAP